MVFFCHSGKMHKLVLICTDKNKLLCNCWWLVEYLFEGGESLWTGVQEVWPVHKKTGRSHVWTSEDLFGNWIFTMKRQRTMHSISLWLFSLLLPSVLCENLRCYYSPIANHETRGLFKLVVTECPPKELCYKAHGSYGSHSALTARGCMLLKDCSQVTRIRFRGVIYNTSYSCCDWPYCNSSARNTANLVTLFIVALIIEVMLV